MSRTLIGVLSYKWRWNARSCYLCQDSLVVGVSVRAGAGLAVLRRADGGVAEEARGALLTELALSVVQAALEGERQVMCIYGSVHAVPVVPLCGDVAPRTVQMPVSGWQDSEWPLHSHSSQ